jgi:hypothetical protein
VAPALSAVDPLIFSTFLSLGAAGWVDYLVAQLIREITFHSGVNDSATGEADVLQRLTPHVMPLGVS